MVEQLEALFPELRGTIYRISSPPDERYNCIAFAAGFTNNWWWPHGDTWRAHWPWRVPRALTLDAFRDAFATLSYVRCDSEEPEDGYEKVALFADVRQEPTHAARQLPNGQWTSKLGMGEDIEHALHALEGEIYGTVVMLMKRPIPATATAGVAAP
jgi:hypothetical protein